MSAHSNILILGKEGQIGSHLSNRFGGSVSALGRSDFDLNDFSKIREKILEFKPNLIINAAAFTAVDLAEEQKEESYKINALLLKELGRLARAVSARVFHYSTDYVFDGSGTLPFLETSSPQPLNYYGQTKYEGEKFLKASGASYFILRVSGVYHFEGNNFVLKIMDKIRSRMKLKVVEDQVGSPTYAKDIAEVTRALCQKDWKNEVLHFANRGELSWFDFAVEIQKQALELGLIDKPVEILPIKTADLNLAAKRPLNSRLSLEKLHQKYQIYPRDWREALRDCLKDLNHAPMEPESIENTRRL